ncbi:MAG: EAL domain-containing protein [Ilumatobacteraceae bacterium]
MSVIAAAQLLPVVLIAYMAKRIRRTFATLFGLAGVCFAVAELISGQKSMFDSALASGLALAAMLGLAAGTLLMVRDRPLLGQRGVSADALIVGLGSWIISWVALVHPLLHRPRHQIPAALLYGAYESVAVLVLFGAIVLLLGFKRRPTSLLMIVGALGLNIVGDIVGALSTIHHVGFGLDRISPALYVAAYFIAGAALLHPSINTLWVAPRNAHETGRLGRVVVTTTASVLPVIVLAATGLQGHADQIVRSVSALLLALAVMSRVVNSIRSNTAAQEALRRGAQTDPLTGLPNRTVLLDRVNACIGESWDRDVQPALYFVDLDRFKNINDSLGHAVGDEVLEMVAQRLLGAVPDGAIVARLSGDEYVVFEPTAQSAAGAMDLADRLLAVFREPLALSQGDVFVTASIGMATMSSSSSSTPEDLLRHADTAMYRAKDAGRNCIALYDESMHERVAHRLAVETALYRALDRHELRLFHQPILDMETGDVEGFEALMRWQRPDGTIVSPAEFIPIAEDTGMIVPIGSWALLEALGQLHRWTVDGICSASATISVNVSPRQLADPHFPSIVSEALARSTVPAGRLWLEVTESMMIAEPELALATLRRLHSLGVRVALDDFGTGYSSLSLLQKFPLQRIKIDRAFVHGVADNPNDRSLVRTIVAMGRSLGLDIVAEGVETVQQLQVLSDLGCKKAQGFLISHPVPADAMRSTVAALERLGNVPGLRALTLRPTSVG